MTHTPDAGQRNAARQDELLTARLALAIHNCDESKLRPEHIQVLNRERLLQAAARRFLTYTN